MFFVAEIEEKTQYCQTNRSFLYLLSFLWAEGKTIHLEDLVVKETFWFGYTLCSGK
jgi:hypothetical protein